MEGPAVECRGLTKRYGPVVALAGLDLEIPPGTVFGFLGPNGAGKTTTLRLLTGLARPTGGTARVAGAEVSPGWASRPRRPADGARTAERTGIGDGAGGPDGTRAAFAYLDQDPRFYGWMRGRELLGLVADLCGLKDPDRTTRISEMLELVGLTDAAGRAIGGYSGGMRQRLGLGAALLDRPAVLFLDEPVSALDPAGRHDVLDVIGGLRGSTTVFMSTHILNDVERVCDRVAILDHGRLLADAPIDDLLARYARPVYRLEPEDGQDGAVAALLTRLGEQAWCTGVEVEADGLRIHVGDPAAAGPALLRLLAESSLAVSLLERQRPSLEDVFLEIVGRGDAAADAAPVSPDPAIGAAGRPA